MSVAMLQTAGEMVRIESRVGWVSTILDEAADGETRPAPTPPTASILIEPTRDAFAIDGFDVLTRGAWSRDGDVVMEDVCGTGFDMKLTVAGGVPEFAFRFRPTPRRRLEARLLPSRHRLLLRAALVQYPVMWWAAVRGRAPLHAIACELGDTVVLLAGPGGVGKSTLLAAALEDGASATSDNLCVADGRVAWGLVEPMRIEGAGGRRTTHGRGEGHLRGRVPQLLPDRILVVRRGRGDTAVLSRCDSDTAERSLVTGTYMAGELRRFWAFAATLAAGTGLGPWHPPVVDVARSLATRLPCYSLDLARRPGTRLSQILKPMEATA